MTISIALEERQLLSPGDKPGAPPVILRFARLSDNGFIGRLSREVFTAYGPYDDILSGWFKSDKRITTIIASQDRKRIGFAMLGDPYNRDELQDVSELLGIAVEPEKQGKGIGGLLLSAIERASVSLEIKCVFLHTAVDNLSARKLYERNGYRTLEIKRNFYPEGQDAIVMYKNI